MGLAVSWWKWEEKFDGVLFRGERCSVILAMEESKDCVMWGSKLWWSRSWWMVSAGWGVWLWPIFFVLHASSVILALTSVAWSNDGDGSFSASADWGVDDTALGDGERRMNESDFLRLLAFLICREYAEWAQEQSESISEWGSDSEVTRPGRAWSDGLSSCWCFENPGEAPVLGSGGAGLAIEDDSGALNRWVRELMGRSEELATGSAGRRGCFSEGFPGCLKRWALSRNPKWLNIKSPPQVLRLKFSRADPETAFWKIPRAGCRLIFYSTKKKDRMCSTWNDREDIERVDTNPSIILRNGEI